MNPFSLRRFPARPATLPAPAPGPSGAALKGGATSANITDARHQWGAGISPVFLIIRVGKTGSAHRKVGAGILGRGSLWSLGDNRGTAILAVRGHGQARPGSVRYRPTVRTSCRERAGDARATRSGSAPQRRFAGCHTDSLAAGGSAERSPTGRQLECPAQRRQAAALPKRQAQITRYRRLARPSHHEAERTAKGGFVTP